MRRIFLLFLALTSACVVLRARTGPNLAPRTEHQLVDPDDPVLQVLLRGDPSQRRDALAKLEADPLRQRALAEYLDANAGALGPLLNLGTDGELAALMSIPFVSNDELRDFQRMLFSGGEAIQRQLIALAERANLDIEQRCVVLEILREVGAAPLPEMPVTEALLVSTDLGSVGCALHALLPLGNVSAIRRAIDETRQGGRRYIELSEAGPTVAEIVPVLLNRYSDASASDQDSIFFTLVWLRDARALPLLRLRLGDRAPEKAAMAALGIGLLEPGVATPDLRAELAGLSRSHSRDVAKAATLALSRLEGRAKVPPHSFHYVRRLDPRFGGFGVVDTE